MSCYCHECQKYYASLGIARHRAMHRDKKEKCKITYSDGSIIEFDYSDKKPDSITSPSCLT